MTLWRPVVSRSTLNIAVRCADRWLAALSERSTEDNLEGPPKVKCNPLSPFCPGGGSQSGPLKRGDRMSEHVSMDFVHPLTLLIKSRRRWLSWA